MGRNLKVGTSYLVFQLSCGYQWLGHDVFEQECSWAFKPTKPLNSPLTYWLMFLVIDDVDGDSGCGDAIIVIVLLGDLRFPSSSLPLILYLCFSLQQWELPRFWWTNRLICNFLKRQWSLLCIPMHNRDDFEVIYCYGLKFGKPISSLKWNNLLETWSNVAMVAVVLRLFCICSICNIFF